MSMLVTKFQQIIYNTYLAVSKSSQNKPFTLRKDFSDFQNTDYYPKVVKLEKIFSSHPEIKMDLFFKAPYALHPNEIFDLNFYISFKALKCYTMYLKALEELPYDDTYQLHSIKSGLQFIKKYCIEQNLNNIKSYLTESTNGVYPDWFSHVKNRKIPSVIMFGFNNTKSVIENISLDIVNMLIPEFSKNYYSNLSKFNNSAKAKQLVQKGLELVNNQINN